ncbi:hypothetical protein GQ44DRAFT_772076 [Phaeosphaeriaceae sp. PMI808]|nr:hypothetical protein GQ44DRAFT_772076 [Phaeosphaeriaceae sp. PMI808]
MRSNPSRSSSPLNPHCESYENTRETTRLHTGYQIPESKPKVSEKTVRLSKADRVIFRIQLLLRAFSFLLASSIVGTLGYIIWLYQSTKDHDVDENGEGVWLDVWLTHLKVKPTYALLGVSATAAILSLIHIIASLSQPIRRVTKIGNLATATVSAIGVLLWVGFGVWYKSDDWNKDQLMDITTYVCRQQHNQALRRELGNMSALCISLRYAWWAVLGAGVIECFAIITVIWGISMAREKGPYVRI